MRLKRAMGGGGRIGRIGRIGRLSSIYDYVYSILFQYNY
jgi:hypothetical protein